jgi:D-arabinose 1-dehydrogenase-like Zn-dependent alcohol dehydrogenase
MKGRVAVLKAYGGEFELREYPVPEVEVGAILIRLTRAGICGSDLHIWRGEMKEVYGGLPEDLTFGHEMCGRVERLGAGVETDSLGAPLREGDRVTFCCKRNIRRLPFERVVSHTYPIDQISEAFRQADWLSHGGDPLRISRPAIAC